MGMNDIDDAQTNLAMYSEIMLCIFLWGIDDDNHDLMNDINVDIYIMMQCVFVCL